MKTVHGREQGKEMRQGTEGEKCTQLSAFCTTVHLVQLCTTVHLVLSKHEQLNQRQTETHCPSSNLTPPPSYHKGSAGEYQEWV